MPIGTSGLGTGSFGTMPFGTSLPIGAPQLLRVETIRENMVRVFFDAPVKYSGLLDQHDASNPELFVLTAVAGTVDFNGEQTRAANVVQVLPTDGMANTALDLWLDRPLSSYGQQGQYSLSISGLENESSFVEMDAIDVQVDALFKEVVSKTLDRTVIGTDIANPQLTSMLEGLPVVEGEDREARLGKYQVDADNDLAFDDVRTSYKKRVIRRLVTRRDGFSHLPGYGVGFVTQVKRLALPAVRERLAVEAEQQIKQEPETISVRVTIIQHSPNVWRYRIRVVASFERAGFEFEAPLLNQAA